MSYDATILALGVSSDQVPVATSRLDDLEKQAGKTEAAAGRLEKSWLSTGNVIGAAAAASAIAIVKFAMDAIDAADALNDLALGSGRTIEQLQTLSALADKSGSSLAGMLSVLDVVSKGMARSEHEAGRYARALEFFGVSATDASGRLKNSEAVAYEVAVAYSEAGKSASTSAAAQIALGGAYEKQIPALLALKDQQSELNKLREYGALVDDNLTAASDRYNDTMRDVQSIVSGVGNDLARMFLPILQAVAEWFIRSATNGGVLTGALNILKAGLEVLAVAVKVVVGTVIALDAALQVAGKGIGAFFAMVSRPFDAASIWKELKADVKIINEQTNKALEDLFRGLDKSGTSAAAAGKDLGDFSARAGSTGKAVKAVTDELAKLIQKYTEIEKAEARGLAPQTIRELELLDASLAKGRIGWTEYLALSDKIIARDPVVAAGQKAIAKAMEESAKAAEKMQEAYDQAIARYADGLAKSVEAIEKQADAEEMRVRTLGLAKSAVTDLMIVQEQANLTTLRAGDADEVAIKATEARIAALERLRSAQAQGEAVESSAKAVEAQKKQYEDLFNYIDSFGREAFAALTDSGGNAAKKITEVFKSTLLALLYKLTIQPFIVNIAAVISGQGGAGGPISSLLGGGSGGSMSGILDLFKNSGGGMATGLFESFALSSMGAALGLSATVAETAGIVAGGLSLAVEAGATAVAGLTALGTTVLAAIPVVGWIAAAAIVAWQIWGNKGGGPKGGGFATSGDVSGITNTDSTGRWFTPGGEDSTVQKIVDATAKSYTELIKQFGGTGGATFALGFDTDPAGTAPNRVHAGAFLGNRPVYDAPISDLGRDQEDLQAALQLEAKRSLLAALQASDLPEYLANLLNSVDVATADGAAIDNIIATAQALKLVVDVMGQMGDKFAALDPAQMEAVVTAFGGLEAFLNSAAFLNENFTTNAEKTATVTAQLNEAFAALNLGIPATHEAFLALLSSFDLTTEAGRAAYAAVSALAPAFVRVNGTAQDAADAANELAAEEEQLTAARREAIAAAKDFFQANFYSEQEQAATQLDANWAIVHAAWTDMGEQLLALGLTSIPTTNAAFRTLIETLRAQGLDDLADSLILIAPAIFGINAAVDELSTAADNAGNTISDSVDTINKALERAQEAAGIARDAFGAVSSAIEDLIGQSGGNFGDKLALRLLLLGEQIKKYEQLISAEESGPNMYGPLITEYKIALQKLKEANAASAKELARFRILAAQYDAERAEAMVELEAWYADMQVALAGSTEALAALKITFDEKWQAIIDGTAGGVTDTLDEFKRLQEGIREFIDSLKLSDISPLTPTEKLAEAKKQYEDLLALAQGGDMNAMSQITGAADAYLQIAREYFASSQAYTDIFNSVLAALEGLATMEKPAAPSAESADTALIAALPVNSKLASKDDLDTLAKRFIEGLDAMAAENAANTQAVVSAVQSTANTIVDGVKVGSK